MSIGITADSFVVYFERLKDEVREGRTLSAHVWRAQVGRVSLLTGELQVPRHLQVLLPPEPPSSQVARDDDLYRPHFTAVVRSGARREVWLESVQP